VIFPDFFLLEIPAFLRFFFGNFQSFSFAHILLEISRFTMVLTKLNELFFPIITTTTNIVID
jgi:hypothetical protein